MYKSALLLISECASPSRLIKLFEFASSHASHRVYVSIEAGKTSIAECLRHISVCYSTAEKLSTSSASGIDVRFVLPTDDPGLVPFHTTRQADLLIVDSSKADDEVIRQRASRLLHKVPSILLHANVGLQGDEDVSSSHDCPTQPYNYVAMGGTFDRLHNGHKVLLSVAALFCNRMLTVGMTTRPMLKSKMLSELIEPLQERSRHVHDFLLDIKPGLHYHICALDDPFGPPAHDPRYEALVATPETAGGCARINELRTEHGMKPCRVHLLGDMLGDHRAGREKLPEQAQVELKVSSSSIRRRLLGTLLHPTRRPFAGATVEPYVIGLTGGIACGKSTIAKRLGSYGAYVLNADVLAHECYLPGTACYERLVSHFGTGIVDEETSRIDRRKMGAIVFTDKNEMKFLSSIVWPATIHLATEKIEAIWAEHHQKSKEPCVIVFEAAVLFDAGWQSMCHEVWAAFIPPEEAVRRIQERNGLSEAEASSRVTAQKANCEYIKNASVVFCTMWDYEFSQHQNEQAWRLLQKRLQCRRDAPKL